MRKRDFAIIGKGVNWHLYKDKTILVSGATGRLGRYIIDAFVEADVQYNLNLRVIALARNEKKLKDFFNDLEDYPNISFLVQDVNLPIRVNDKVDFIFHTAGPAAPRDFKDTPVETLWSHVNGTHNILEFARENGSSRIIYISTVEVYGEWLSDSLIKESDMGPLQHFNSRACYPEAKRLCETMFACYGKEFGIDYQIVHLSHTLGPGIVLDDGRAFAEFIDCALKGIDITLHSDGSSMRTYTYTSDVINAIMLMIEKGDSKEVYNIAANENLISIRDLAELVAELSPKRTTKVTFGEDAKGLPYLPFKLAIMDSSKIRKLGWTPQTDLRTMLKWTIESFL